MSSIHIRTEIPGPLSTEIVERRRAAFSNGAAFLTELAVASAEGAVVTESLQCLEDGSRKIVTFGYSDDEAFAVGLTCGGTIHLYLEPLDW